MMPAMFAVLLLFVVFFGVLGFADGERRRSLGLDHG